MFAAIIILVHAERVNSQATVCTDTKDGTRSCASGCSQARCTSRVEGAAYNAFAGYDCWAGNNIEKCLCSSGSPMLLGTSKVYEKYTYDMIILGANAYEYTCCTILVNGSSFDDENCGDCCDYTAVLVFYLSLFLFCFGVCNSAAWTTVTLMGFFDPPVISQEHHLWVAARDGDLVKVNSLLGSEEGVDVNFSQPDGSFLYGFLDSIHYGGLPLSRYYGTTPLMIAANQGQHEVLEALLSANADVNLANRWGWTPLGCSACSYLFSSANVQARLLKSLLDRKADPTVKTFEACSTPLMLAQTAGMDQSAHILSNTEHETQLLNAAENNDPVAAAEVLKRDAKVNIESTEMLGETALYLFAKNDNVDGIKLLTGKHMLSTYTANINVQDENGMTALHWAAKHGNVATCKLLLEDVNSIEIDQITTIEGLTALHLAGLAGCHHICKMLLKANAAVDIKTNRSNAGHGNAITGLEDCNAITGQRTALHLAAEAGHEEVCEVLINADAWSHACDEGGSTCLDLALQERVHQLVKEDFEKEQMSNIELILDAIADTNGSQHRLLRSPEIVATLLLVSAVPAVVDTVFDWMVTIELLRSASDMDNHLGQISLTIIIGEHGGPCK